MLRWASTVHSALLNNTDSSQPCADSMQSPVWLGSRHLPHEHGMTTQQQGVLEQEQGCEHYFSVDYASAVTMEYPVTVVERMATRLLLVIADLPSHMKVTCWLVCEPSDHFSRCLAYIHL